ncbi:MAG: hypothetical protein Q4E07_04565 [Eubacteriales bacterium]|nr:hypothetical protein [Eubacteriales bacterium]
MSFVKCPRCELNYMKDTDKYCDVCQSELFGDASEDEVELCSICGESPALPGKDVCLFCQREMSGHAKGGVSGDEDLRADDEDTDDEDAEDVDSEDLEDIEDLDDFEELDELDDMMSLDEMADDEHEDDEEDIEDL